MPRNRTQDGDALAHIVVCGGTPGEWAGMSAGDWGARFSMLATGAAHAGVRWVTVLPHHGTLDDEMLARVNDALDGVGKVEPASPGSVRRVWRRDDGLSVVVDPRANGHARFASVVESLRAAGSAINESTVASAVLAPAVAEPDLALIIGPPDDVPPSLVWELAYSELVFLDIEWSGLQSTHLEMAIDDFSRRHRRFGGLDS